MQQSYLHLRTWKATTLSSLILLLLYWTICWKIKFLHWRTGNIFSSHGTEHSGLVMADAEPWPLRLLLTGGIGGSHKGATELQTLLWIVLIEVEVRVCTNDTNGKKVTVV